MKDFAGKVAVLTGGAGGIGKGIAEALLDEGARVVLADVDPAALEVAAKDLGGRGGVSWFQTDVTNPDSVEKLAEHVYETHGVCHLVFNNAGVSNGDALTWRTTPNDWQWVFAVNVFGVAYGMMSFVPRMIEGGVEGHVVNTSSGNGGFSILARAGLYAASKSAVSAITEACANQLVMEGTKIRASVFYPSGGLLRTGLLNSERNRHPEWTREREREAPEKDWDTVMKWMEDVSGKKAAVMDLHELGRIVLDGIRNERYVIGADVERAAQSLLDRAQTLAKSELPVSKP